jgi:hypothetical protein
MRVQGDMGDKGDRRDRGHEGQGDGRKVDRGQKGQGVRNDRRDRWHDGQGTAETEGTGGTERTKRTVRTGKGQNGQQAVIFPAQLLLLSTAQLLSGISQKINTILGHGLNRNYPNLPENTAMRTELLLQQ